VRYCKFKGIFLHTTHHISVAFVVEIHITGKVKICKIILMSAAYCHFICDVRHLSVDQVFPENFVPRPCKIAANIIILHILYFLYLDLPMVLKQWPEYVKVASFPYFILLTAVLYRYLDSKATN
jgi:hypothetical protein